MHLNSLPELVRLVAYVAPLVIFFAIPGILRAFAKRREWEHLERLKALELGHPLPPDTKIRGMLSIGLIIPALSIIGASISCMSLSSAGSDASLGLAETIWICAAVISVAGLALALIVSLVQLNMRWDVQNLRASEDLAAKPAIQPEDYHFVGSRN